MCSSISGCICTEIIGSLLLFINFSLLVGLLIYLQLNFFCMFLVVPFTLLIFVHILLIHFRYNYFNETNMRYRLDEKNIPPVIQNSVFNTIKSSKLLIPYFHNKGTLITTVYSKCKVWFPYSKAYLRVINSALQIQADRYFPSQYNPH
mgnify:CR=1 FL=1|jgi:hypothetical protein